MPDATMREPFTDYGVHIFDDDFPGFTILRAVDRDGSRLCELAIRSDLLRERHVTAMRAWLAEHARPPLKLVRS